VASTHASTAAAHSSGRRQYTQHRAASLTVRGPTLSRHSARNPPSSPAIQSSTATRSRGDSVRPRLADVNGACAEAACGVSEKVRACAQWARMSADQVASWDERVSGLGCSV
jgi:hypothetical protein